MLVLWSCALWIAAVIAIFAGLAVDRLVSRQKEINEALADYVAADLQKTWEASAHVLVNMIRAYQPKK